MLLEVMGTDAPLMAGLVEERWCDRTEFFRNLYLHAVAAFRIALAALEFRRQPRRRK